MGSGLMVEERTDLGRGVNNDAIETNIRRREEKMIRIVNIYDQRTMGSGVQ
jgi:hypothetical protein